VNASELPTVPVDGPATVTARVIGEMTIVAVVLAVAELASVTVNEIVYVPFAL